MEFEFLDGLADLFAEAEAGGEDLALGEGAQVEQSEAVQAFADGPAIAPEAEPAGAPAPANDPAPANEPAPASSTVANIRAFIQNNPYASTMWQLAKAAGKNVASAGKMFVVMYGLNKLIAQNAQTTGNRTALSQYLASVQQNFQKNGLPWNDQVKAQAAQDALAFPWIDATQ